jgi:hypothetical protein
MKKLFFIVLLLSKVCDTYCQSLLKISYEEPEIIFYKKIREQLRLKLNSRTAPGCKSYIFYVKFELSEKSEIQNVKVSANMTDSLIVSIIQKVIKENESIWDIEKCKKNNPTLRFLVPINIDIYGKDCNMQHSDAEVVKARFDFASLLKYDPKAERELRDLYAPPREKFVGMVLSPLSINNADASY